MSSKKSDERMPIRIDNEVHLWVMVLKEALNESSVSSTLRRVIVECYPNIQDVVNRIEVKEDERQKILSQLSQRND